MRHMKQVWHLEREHDVRRGEAAGVVQRMARGKIHPHPAIGHGSLEELG